MKKKMFCLGILFLFACDLSLNAQQTMSVILLLFMTMLLLLKIFLW